MFRNMLVAIDGSPTANRGLRMALDLAKEQHAALHVLHVIDDAVLATSLEGSAYVPPAYMESMLEGMRDTARKVIAAAEKLAAAHDVAIAPIMVEARGHAVAQVILAQARKVHADLIVLGTHGRRGLRRIVMGSDAETVLREATAPVLLVRTTSRNVPAGRAVKPRAVAKRATAAPAPAVGKTIQ